MNNWYLAGIAAVLWIGAYLFYFRGYYHGLPAIRDDMKRLRKALRRMFSH